MNNVTVTKFLYGKDITKRHSQKEANLIGFRELCII